MRASKRSMLKRMVWMVVAGLVLAQLGGSLAQTTPSEASDTLQPLATELTELFEDLVREVPCPPYTYDGGNEPVCGLTELSPEAFTEAFDEAARGRLEPEGAWSEDHTVWLRYYHAQGVRYAAIYSEIARGFNVQFVRLK